jgi:hypothetical protein
MVPSTPARVAWSTPVMTVLDRVVTAQGDPTISDDGLGDGLFSP